MKLYKKYCIIAATIFVGNIIYESKRPSSWLYERIFVPLFHHLNPELSHNIAIKMAKIGLYPKSKKIDSCSLGTFIWNKQFSNPLGL